MGFGVLVNSTARHYNMKHPNKTVKCSRIVLFILGENEILKSCLWCFVQWYNRGTR